MNLAWNYAFNKSIAKQNKVRLNDNVSIDIIDFHGNYLHSRENLVQILIISEFELSIPIKKFYNKN